MLEPSGEKRGKSSGPSVRAASSRVMICCSQIRGLPSRAEVKATVWPSIETAGEVSWPEKVKDRTDGRLGGAPSRIHSAATMPPSRGPASASDMGLSARARKPRAGGAAGAPIRLTEAELAYVRRGKAR